MRFGQKAKSVVIICLLLAPGASTQPLPQSGHIASHRGPLQFHLSLAIQTVYTSILLCYKIMRLLKKSTCSHSTPSNLSEWLAPCPHREYLPSFFQRRSLIPIFIQTPLVIQPPQQTKKIKKKKKGLTPSETHRQPSYIFSQKKKHSFKPPTLWGYPLHYCHHVPMSHKQLLQQIPPDLVWWEFT